MSCYDALVRAAPGLRWPGRGHVFTASLRDLDPPLHMRLGSTDGFVAEEVFLRNVYGAVRSAAPAETRSVLDLGANVGFSAMLWHAWWPAATIWAGEPDGANLDVLHLNVAPFASQVHVIRACAVGTPRPVELDRNHGAAAFRRREVTDPTGIHLPGRSVAELLDTHAIADLDLLKCDIEGAEREVFANCHAWIGRVRCMVVELHDDYGVAELEDCVVQGGGRFERMESGDPTIAILRRAE